LRITPQSLGESEFGELREQRLRSWPLSTGLDNAEAKQIGEPAAKSNVAKVKA
jgi:hypothetical protein